MDKGLSLLKVSWMTNIGLGLQRALKTDIGKTGRHDSVLPSVLCYDHEKGVTLTE